MLSLYFIGSALLLLIGFFALTEYEARRGIRVFAEKRERLDHIVERTAFVVQNVDLESFLRAEFKRLSTRLSHDAAHLSLQAVRAIERVLTRLVRYLRSRDTADAVPRENAREFVRTLSDFKDSLKATYPEVTEMK